MMSAYQSLSAKLESSGPRPSESLWRGRTAWALGFEQVAQVVPDEPRGRSLHAGRPPGSSCRRVKIDADPDVQIRAGVTPAAEFNGVVVISRIACIGGRSRACQ